MASDVSEGVGSATPPPRNQACCDELSLISVPAVGWSGPLVILAVSAFVVALGLTRLGVANARRVRPASSRSL